MFGSGLNSLDQALSDLVEPRPISAGAPAEQTIVKSISSPGDNILAQSISRSGINKQSSGLASEMSAGHQRTQQIKEGETSNALLGRSLSDLEKMMEEEAASMSVCGIRFDIDPTVFELQRPLGRGSYGVVAEAVMKKRNLVAERVLGNRFDMDSIDWNSGLHVAIKKSMRVFETVSDAKRTLRELRLLRHLYHENIVNIIDILPPAKPYFVRDTFTDVYIVLDLMETDLHAIIHSPQTLTDDHIKYFLYQTLRGLLYIHSASILHRDLKPSNLLVNSNCDLKICDFGLARVSNPAENKSEFLTEYVATRWYRAPEIMLSWNEYTTAVDVWSVGCILGELIGRKPLFPGKDYLHQLEVITQIIGSPTEEDLQYVENERARKYMLSRPKHPRRNLREYFSAFKPSPLGLDLLEKMLQFNPSRRITVHEALRHPYLAELHDPSDEPVSDIAIDWEFDYAKLDKSQLRDRIYEEMRLFHPEIADWVLEERARSSSGIESSGKVVAPVTEAVAMEEA